MWCSDVLLLLELVNLACFYLATCTDNFCLVLFCSQGRGGSKIRELQEDSNCKIKVRFLIFYVTVVVVVCHV